MHEALCILIFLAALCCGGTALVSIIASAGETAPGTSFGTAITRGAFLHRKHFTERGWRLRTRALWFQLSAMALVGVFFFTCAEL